MGYSESKLSPKTQEFRSAFNLEKMQGSVESVEVLEQANDVLNGIEDPFSVGEVTSETIAVGVRKSVDFEAEGGNIVGANLSPGLRQTAGLMYFENVNDETTESISAAEMLDPLVTQGGIAEGQKMAMEESFDAAFGAQSDYAEGLNGLVENPDPNLSESEQAAVTETVTNIQEKPKKLTPIEEEVRLDVVGALKNKTQALQDKWANWRERKKAIAERSNEEQAAIDEAINDMEFKKKPKLLNTMKKKVVYGAAVASVVAMTALCTVSGVVETAAAAAPDAGPNIETISNTVEWDGEGLDPNDYVERHGEMNAEGVLESMTELSPEEAKDQWNEFIDSNPDLSITYVDSDGGVYSTGNFNEVGTSEIANADGLPELVDGEARYFPLTDESFSAANDNDMMIYHHNNFEKTAEAGSFTFPADSDSEIMIIGDGENQFVFVTHSSYEETLNADGSHIDASQLLRGFDDLGEGERPTVYGQTCPSGNMIQQGLAQMGAWDNTEAGRHVESYKLAGKLTPELAAQLGISNNTASAIAQTG